MATFNRIKLSASTSGKPTAVAATATPGTTIHQAVAGAIASDEIYIFATNTSANPETLTIEFGGTAAADLILKQASIPPLSFVTLVIPGLLLNGGLTVAAFASTTNVINLSGYANRIS